MATKEMSTKRTDPNRLDAIPFPGKRYMIFYKGSAVALYVHAGKLKWLELSASQLFTGPPSWTWLVVAQNGYIGFFNEGTGTFLGYSNDMLMPVKKFDCNAYFVIRNVESGGFALQAKARKDSIKEVLVTTPCGKLELADPEGSYFKFYIL
jgi:hypothetical protein